MMYPNPGYSVCLWDDYLSIQKERDVGLKGACCHLEPLKAATIQASLVALTLPTSALRTSIDQTQSNGAS